MTVEGIFSERNDDSYITPGNSGLILIASEVIKYKVVSRSGGDAEFEILTRGMYNTKVNETIEAGTEISFYVISNANHVTEGFVSQNFIIGDKNGEYISYNPNDGLTINDTITTYDIRKKIASLSLLISEFDSRGWDKTELLDEIAYYESKL